MIDIALGAGVIDVQHLAALIITYDNKRIPYYQFVSKVLIRSGAKRPLLVSTWSAIKLLTVLLETLYSCLLSIRLTRGTITAHQWQVVKCGISDTGRHNQNKIAVFVWPNRQSWI
jgi:hypothetical protein